jgi:hypothetical protein
VPRKSNELSQPIARGRKPIISTSAQREESNEYPSTQEISLRKELDLSALGFIEPSIDTIK